MASDSRQAPPHGGSTPPVRPATPSTSERVRHKIESWLRRPSSRGKKGEAAEHNPVGAVIAQEPNTQAASTTTPETLLVKTESIDIQRDTLDPARKIAGYELAIAVIEIFQPVVECTDFILPTPVGKALERLTKVLGVLKKMVENREAWKGLHETLVHHGEQFNKQLVRLKQNNTKPSEDSAILGPLRDYSTALERLSAKIILESGLVQQDTKGNPGWERIKKFATKYLSADSEKAQVETYRQALRDAMQALSQDLLIYVAFSISEQPSQSPAPRKKVIAKRPPKVSQYYVKREREWKFMVDSITDSTKPGQKILAITGVGGCGKTQLVSYFLKEKYSLFTHMVYVDASSTASIEADLQTWAQSLGDGHEKDDWKTALYLLADGRWVYILDNADDPELDLPPFIPESSDGTVIITSRNQAVGSLAQYRLLMGEMTEKEVLSALIKAARRESPIPSEELESATTLIKELGCLALAIVHVGAYCDQLSSAVAEKYHVFTFTRYLTRFYSSRAALMKAAGPPTIDGYKRLGVYTTLDLSYEKLPQSAKDFFRLISNFHYADIPMEMLAVAAERRFCDPVTLIPRDETSVSRLIALLGIDRSVNEHQTEAVIQTLLSFSLVSTTFVEDLLFLRIHPLVQAWVRDKSPDGEDYGAMATQVLTSSSIDSNFSIYRYLLPHIFERLIYQSSSLHVNDQAAFGPLLMRMGHYSLAETLFQGALKSFRRTSMQETENTLWAVGELASIYRAQGRYSEAEKQELEVVEGRRRILGVDHLGTIAAAAHLADTYRMQRRHSEAEKLQLKVLEQLETILGVDHLDTTTAASNLALTYSMQGRFTEAQKLQMEVLEKWRRILGANHPDTIKAAANLAMTYGRQGRYGEAEMLLLEVMEMQAKILGTDHPSTLRTASSLSEVYGRQGRYSEAEKLKLEVLEKRRRILGADHPDTINAAARLARIYRAQGRLEEARKLEGDTTRKADREVVS